MWLINNWTTCANAALCPKFGAAAAPSDGALSFRASGNGREHVYGQVAAATAPLSANTTYCLVVELEFTGLPQPEDLHRHMYKNKRPAKHPPGAVRLCIFVGFEQPDALRALRAHPLCRRVELVAEDWVGGIQTYHRGAGGKVTGMRRFKPSWPGKFAAPAGTDAPATIKLLYKFAPHGAVYFRKLGLTQCADSAPRKPVKIAAAWWKESPAGVGGDWHKYWSAWLDAAGAAVSRGLQLQSLWIVLTAVVS